MRHLSRRFFTILSPLLFICVITGCNSEEDLKKDYDNYKFDPQVIAKLPAYDSLVSVIIQNFPAFGKFIGEDRNPSFLYIPSTEEPDIFIKLPPAAASKVEPYFNRPGKDFIYGFEIFRDSSVKILVRKRFSERSKVDIAEYLSYYPAGNKGRRVFPVKDTLLNTHWQYWARFSMRDEF